MTAKSPEKLTPEETVDRKIRRRTFISFAAFIGLGAAAYEGWEWLYHSPQEALGTTGGARKPLRKALNQTELFFRRLFDDRHHVKLYSKSMAAKDVRVNGDLGITDAGFDQSKWQLKVQQADGRYSTVNIDSIRALPKTELVFSFKCVEGWDQVQHWAGVTFADFVAHFNLSDQAKKAYVGMETPDGGYYVGLDRESALHPQTILAYEMNGKPILPEHGAPLRLIIPVKYGIKNIKRIGKISFSNNRPRDYWAEQGYDYYSGL